MLVQRGTLDIGDTVIVGSSIGRIRAMTIWISSLSAISFAAGIGLTLNAIIIAFETFASVTSDSVTAPAADSWRICTYRKSRKTCRSKSNLFFGLNFAIAF